MANHTKLTGDPADPALALPEVFWPDDCVEPPKPMLAPIVKVYIRKLGPNAETVDIDVTTLDAVPNQNAVRDTYGPGKWELVGRAATGQVVARRVMTLNMPMGRPAPNTGADAPPAAPYAAPYAPQYAAPPNMIGKDGRLDPNALVAAMAQRPGMDPMGLAMLQMVLTMSTELATQGRESGKHMVQAVTELAKARIVDAQDIGAVTAARQGGAGGGGGRGDWEKGFDKAMDLFNEALKQQKDGGASEESLTELVKAVAQGVGEFNRLREPDNVVSFRPRNPGAGGGQGG